MARLRSPLDGLHGFGANEHPSDHALLPVVLDPVVYVHHKGCARCRVRRRKLQIGFIEPEEPTSHTSTAHDPPEARSTPDTQGAVPDTQRAEPSEDQPWKTVSDALVTHPGQLVRWMRQAIAELHSLHTDGHAHGGLTQEPRVVGTRLCLPAKPERCATDARHDWRQLGEWMRVWLQIAPARGYEYLASRLLGDEPVHDVPHRLLLLDDAFVDVHNFEERNELGMGGMGWVLRVRDHVLHRDIALKTMREDRRSPALRQRFLAEAQLTAQLDHPGIVPVHSIGVLPDGTPFYTMRVVEDRPLSKAVAAFHSPSEQPSHDEEPQTLRRLIDSLGRACEALAYAHSKGVVHRDVKPDNVMLGAFGQVMVIDWGLARAPEDPALGDVQIAQVAGGLTQVGTVLGTRGYRSPEQEAGEHDLVDARSDVYAIGATLFEILTGDVPSGPEHAQALHDKPVPAALADLAIACMSRHREGRPADAGEVVRALRSWQQGQDRYRRASDSMEAVQALRSLASELASRAVQQRQRAAVLLDEVKSYEPASARAEGWRLEDQAADLERRGRVAEARYEQGLRAALDHDPQHQPALDALAALYKDSIVRAERADRTAEVARMTTLLHDHDAGRHRPWLAGGGHVSLVTDPPGATVIAHRLGEVGRRLVPVQSLPLGTTPLHKAELARGSYLLELRAKGCDTFTYPVMIERASHWHGVAPGDTEPTAIWLPPVGVLHADEVYVPSGWFVAGGDEQEGTDPMPQRWLWCDGFVMQRHPVTHGQFLAFLNDLVVDGQVVRAEEFAPSLDRTEGDPGLYERMPNGGFCIPTSGQVGWMTFTTEHPVSRIDWHAATAFAAWRAARRGRAVRLPHSLEWEKAAVGVDGRPLPWGRTSDASWARMNGSVEGRPMPAAVHEHPDDVGPYGVRGMAGNVRTWCLDVYCRAGPAGPRLQVKAGEQGPLRSARGGSFASSPRMCRSRSRLTLRPEGRASPVGMRVLWPLSKDPTP